MKKRIKLSPKKSKKMFVKTANKTKNRICKDRQCEAVSACDVMPCYHPMTAWRLIGGIDKNWKVEDYV